MRYVLAVLSHGNPCSETAEACLDSFLDHVTPMPAFVCYKHDGPGYAFIGIGQQEGAGMMAQAGAIQMGFCRATRSLWASAARTAVDVRADFVLWLEHDFKFIRPVDLDVLSAVLDANPQLAQMALMRGPESPQELEAGGLVASKRGEFAQRYSGAETGSEAHPWLEHLSYFTTTPSLMRVGFMLKDPWPDYDNECEGRYGIDLAELGYSFGVWGAGEPWVEHIGERSGFGY